MIERVVLHAGQQQQKLLRKRRAELMVRVVRNGGLALILVGVGVCLGWAFAIDVRRLAREFVARTNGAGPCPVVIYSHGVDESICHLDLDAVRDSSGDLRVGNLRLEAALRATTRCVSWLPTATVELKGDAADADGVAQLAAAARRVGAAPALVVTDPRLAAAAKAHDLNVVTAYRTTTPTLADIELQRRGVGRKRLVAIAPSLDLLVRNRFTRAHVDVMPPLIVWVVDDAQDALTAIDLGASAIISNRPHHLRTALHCARDPAPQAGVVPPRRAPVFWWRVFYFFAAAAPRPTLRTNATERSA